MIEVRVTEFTRVPGPRFCEEGPHSGEEFREKYLLPQFEVARNAGEPLVVHLDGVKFGYPTSFLEEAFGGLVRRLGNVTGDQVIRGLSLLSNDEPLLVREIHSYIQNAHKTSRQRIAG